MIREHSRAASVTSHAHFVEITLFPEKRIARVSKITQEQLVKKRVARHIVTVSIDINKYLLCYAV